MFKTGTTGIPTLLQNLSYTYYSAGNLDDITGTVRNASTGTNISANQSFVYDALDRLTSATGPYGTQTFTYSAIGNITNNSVLGNYTYSTKPHAVTQTGSTTYTYDNNGNMSGGNGRTFIYDFDNRPTSITLSGVTTTMVYDAGGNRVKKTVGSTTSVYIGDKYSCTVGGSCSRYVFGGNQRLAAVSGSTTYYYHGDHLGSTHVVTSSTQSPAQTVTYRPFGFTDVNVGSIDVRYKYTDQEIDDSTGFYYYKARYYAPLLARFIQPDIKVPDPVDPQAFNRYAYVLNNPLKYIDPNGADAVEIGLTLNVPRWLGRAIFGEDYIGQGAAVSLAVSYPGFFGGEYDAGIKLEARGGGEDFGFGRYSVDVTYNTGSVRDLGGVGSELSFMAPVGGASLEYDENGSMNGIGIGIGSGLNVGGTGTIGTTFSVRDGIDWLKENNSNSSSSGIVNRGGQWGNDWNQPFIWVDTPSSDSYFGPSNNFNPFLPSLTSMFDSNGVTSNNPDSLYLDDFSSWSWDSLW